jgi:hypothetical protein
MDGEANTILFSRRHIDFPNTSLFTERAGKKAHKSSLMYRCVRLFTMFRVASPSTLRLQFYSFRVRNTVFEL